MKAPENPAKIYDSWSNWYASTFVLIDTTDCPPKYLKEAEVFGPLETWYCIDKRVYTYKPTNAKTQIPKPSL